jgi:ubiquinone/menaquinone biosynthesis C-methylase UbiE
VRCASERAARRGIHNCSFVEGDMEQLPFPPESFDVVISNGGFCLCPDKARAFREIERVLRPVRTGSTHAYTYAHACRPQAGRQYQAGLGGH